MELKNELRDAKLGGRDPVFIDTLSKSWPSDKKYFGRLRLGHIISQQYTVWPRGLNSQPAWTVTQFG